MKILFRTLRWFVPALFITALVAAAIIYLWSEAKRARRLTVAVSAPSLPSNSAALEHGRHLALTRGCLHCHGSDLGGGKVVENKLIGQIFGPNITRGTGGLSANYTLEDWVRALRHGVGGDGRELIIMPSTEFATLSSTDLADLLSFVTTVPPVNRATVPIKLGPLGRVLLVTRQMPVAADVIDHRQSQSIEATPGITVEYGRYLATACMGCHGPNLSGGKIHGAPPDWPPSSNLTPADDAPLAHWSEAQFLTTLRTHQRPDGTELNAIMPREFGQLTDTELKAIFTFLRSLPPRAKGER